MNERHENLRRKNLVCLRPLPVVRRPDFYHRWNFPPCFHSRVEIEHVQRWLPERQTALCGVLPTAISTGAFHWWRDWCDKRCGDCPRAGQNIGLEVQPPMANPLVVQVDLYGEVALLRWKWASWARRVLGRGGNQRQRRRDYAVEVSLRALVVILRAQGRATC